MIEAQSAYQANSKVFQTGREPLGHSQQPEVLGRFDRLPGPRDEPVDRVQHHQLRVPFERGAVGGHLEQHLERQHDRLFARNRQRRDQLLRRLRRRLGHPRGQRGAAGAGQCVDLAGGEPSRRSPTDCRRCRRRSATAPPAPPRRGRRENGNSPSAMLANLQDALTTYEASPSNASAGAGRRHRRDQPRSSLNSGSAAVQQVREQADSDMASSVSTINSLLDQFSQVNATIVSGTGDGRQRRQRRGHARYDSHPAFAADRHFDRRQSGRLDVDLHRQRRDVVSRRRRARSRSRRRATYTAGRDAATP